MRKRCTHTYTHSHTNARMHARTYAHTHTQRERETALTPVNGEGNLCNVKGQESVVNKRLKVYTNGTINIQRVHVHSVHNHEEPQHAWMHVLRHTCRYIYTFGGTDENERKLMITAGIQK